MLHIYTTDDASMFIINYTACTFPLICFFRSHFHPWRKVDPNICKYGLFLNIKYQEIYIIVQTNSISKVEV